jgi:hypothetical protein
MTTTWGCTAIRRRTPLPLRNSAALLNHVRPMKRTLVIIGCLTLAALVVSFALLIKETTAGDLRVIS